MSGDVVAVCPQCGTEWAPQAIVCPGCGRLIHAETLKKLADTARTATEVGDHAAALAAWREALGLLPPESKQHHVISGKITELGRHVSTTAVLPAKKPFGTRSRAAGAAGAVALLLLKLKTLFVGLSQGSTFFSMMLSLGVYWTIWGWKFALGLVLSIYVHEMGHVITLRQYGFKSTAPMFIPGLGALIRLQQNVVNPEEDAEIGLAGPIYGLGAALFVAALWLLTGQPIFAAIAGVGAWVNLFNLTPIGTLDGGRGFHAMSRLHKWLCAAVMLGGWYFTQDGLLLLIALVCGYRASTDKPYLAARPKAAATYVVLVVALTAVSLMRGYAIQ